MALSSTIEIAKSIDDAINTSVFSGDDVAAFMVNGRGYESGMHRYTQSQMFQLAIAYIYELGRAYENGRYDGRNEMAAKKAWRITQLINNDGKEFYNSPEMWSIANHFEKVFSER